MAKIAILFILIFSACSSGFNAYPTDVDNNVVQCVRVEYWSELGSSNNDPKIKDKYEEFCRAEPEQK